jgi:hypothetical protein
VQGSYRIWVDADAQLMMSGIAQRSVHLSCDTLNYMMNEMCLNSAGCVDDEMEKRPGCSFQSIRTILVQAATLEVEPPAQSYLV